MAPQTPQQGESGTESTRMTGTSSNMPTIETQQQCRHHLVDCDSAYAATENMTLDTKLKIVCNTWSSRSKKQHMIRCECSRVEVDGRQQMV